ISLEEVIGKNFFDLNYPEDLAARLQNQIQEVFDRQEIVRDETPFTGAANESGFYEYIFSPVLADGGVVELVAGSTRDITTRKRAELNTEFLALITGDLARLTTIDEMMQTIGAKIGAFFNLSVCAFMEIDEAADKAIATHDWHRADAQGLVGMYRIGEFLTDEFQRASRAGEVFVVRDTVSDSRADAESYRAIDVASFVSVPIVRNGEWCFLLVLFDSAAHDWRNDEIELMREITARIWANLERRRTEEALRESEERLRLATEAAQMYSWEYDAQTETYKFSENAHAILGVDQNALPLTVEATHALIHPDDLKLIRHNLEQALETGEGFALDFRSVTQTGETVWLSVQSAVVKDAAGQVMRVIGIAQDISERKRIEDALRESEERARLLIEGATDFAIFRVAPDNLIASWNTGAERVFGWAESEIIGRSGAILFTPEDREKGVSQKELETALRTGRAEDERWHIRKDGTRFYASGVMMRLKEGAQGFVKIARDQTAKIASEKAVRDKELLQKLVGALEDERKRIARDLHDELGQKLTALRLKLENIRKISEEDEICGKIDEVQLIAKHLDADIDFLAWELRPAALDDLGLIVALGNYVKEWSRHSGVTAEFYASGINDKRLAPEIETNLYRITQEALNNTHKHANAKRADVLLEKSDSAIVLIIEDDGQGFDPEDKMIGEKGLGLIGMRERAALIDGLVEIESASKNGTTIYVRIPINNSEPSA
ncbi:MAG: PAS domain S-box protein, partial [Pyrinomonadaceae bacterium]